MTTHMIQKDATLKKHSKGLHTKVSLTHFMLTFLTTENIRKSKVSGFQGCRLLPP